MEQPEAGILDKNEKEARVKLAYEWVAKYNDGTELHQYDDVNGLVHHFGHIDTEKVREFVLESKTVPVFTISVNLYTGLFSFNGEEVDKIRLSKDVIINLGILLKGKEVVSSWGNKGKLIYVRHMRRDYNVKVGELGTTCVYELGWEAKIDGKHEKHTILIDEGGHVGLPTPEKGFKEI